MPDYRRAWHSGGTCLFERKKGTEPQQRSPRDKSIAATQAMSTVTRTSPPQPAWNGARGSAMAGSAYPCGLWLVQVGLTQKTQHCRPLVLGFAKLSPAYRAAPCACRDGDSQILLPPPVSSASSFEPCCSRPSVRQHDKNIVHSGWDFSVFPWFIPRCAAERSCATRGCAASWAACAPARCLAAHSDERAPQQRAGRSGNNRTCRWPRGSP